MIMRSRLQLRFAADPADEMGPARAAAADVADVSSGGVRRLGWMTAGLLASTAIAGGAQAAASAGSVTVNWDALGAVGGGAHGDMRSAGIAADTASTFLPGSWPHSGEANYGYMRLPRYYGGPVHTPLALTPFQPADRPVLGGDPIAAARNFAAASAAVGEMVPDAPLRSTFDAPDTFTSAARAPATHPVQLASATFLQRDAGVSYVQYGDSVYNPVGLPDHDLVTAEWTPQHGRNIAATSSGRAPIGGAADRQRAPVQLAQLAPSSSYTPPSMHDGAPVTAYDEMPYGQVVPRSLQNPALPQRTFTSLNAPTIRARIHTQRLAPEDFMQPTGAVRFNAAGPRTRLGAPARTPIPAVREAMSSPVAAAPYSSPSYGAPAYGAPRSPDGLLEPPRRSPRSGVNGGPSAASSMPTGGRPGLFRPMDARAAEARAAGGVDAPSARLPGGQLRSGLEPEFAGSGSASASRGTGQQASGAPAPGTVIISSATVGRSMPTVTAAPARQVAKAPTKPSPAKSESRPARKPAAPEAPAAQAETPPTTTRVAPTPAPETSAAPASEPAPPPPPAPSEPVTAAPPPAPVVESPPVTGSSRVEASGAGSGDSGTSSPETAAAPEPPPAPPAPEPEPAPPAEATAPAPQPDPEPTPLPEPPAASSLVAPGGASAPPAPPSAGTGDQVAALSSQDAGLGDGGVMGTVMFEQGDPELTAQARQALARIATELAADETSRIQLNAYAAAQEDNPAGARRLSLTRALAVRKYLIEQGIRSIRMDVRARGSQTEGGSPERVDIVLKSQ